MGHLEVVVLVTAAVLLTVGLLSWVIHWAISHDRQNRSRSRKPRQ